jgi:hypothetical protein
MTGGVLDVIEVVPELELFPVEVREPPEEHHVLERDFITLSRRVEVKKLAKERDRAA